jgi:hypothetical protein
MGIDMLRKEELQKVKKRIKILELFNETWQQNIWYSCCSWDDYAEEVKNIFEIKLEVKESGAGYYRAFNSNGNIILWIWIKPGEEIRIAHEAIHVAIYSLDDRGIDVNNNDDNGEVLCYYVDWILKKIKEGKQHEKIRNGSK